MTEADGFLGPLGLPRIRHITSIRIHKLDPCEFPDIPVDPYSYRQAPGYTLSTSQNDSPNSTVAPDSFLTRSSHGSVPTTRPGRDRRSSSTSVRTVRTPLLKSDRTRPLRSRNNSTGTVAETEDELQDLRLPSPVLDGLPVGSDVATADGSKTEQGGRRRAISSPRLEENAYRSGIGIGRGVAGGSAYLIRPGMGNYRSRSRLIIPKHEPAAGSINTTQAGQGSSKRGSSGTTGMPTVDSDKTISPTSPKLDHHSMIPISQPNHHDRRIRSSSISSLRSVYQPDLPLHSHLHTPQSHHPTLAGQHHGRDRSSTLATLRPPREEDEAHVQAESEEVGEPIREACTSLSRCFVTMSLVHHSRTVRRQTSRPEMREADAGRITEHDSGVVCNGKSRKGKGRASDVKGYHVGQPMERSSADASLRKPNGVLRRSSSSGSSGLLSHTPRPSSSRHSSSSSLSSPPTEGKDNSLSDARSPGSTRSEKSNGSPAKRVGRTGSSANGSAALKRGDNNAGSLPGPKMGVSGEQNGRRKPRSSDNVAGQPTVVRSAEERLGRNRRTGGDVIANEQPRSNIFSALTTNVPFFVSPIHTPSTHPTFSGLDVRSDFADWMTVDDLARMCLRIEYWVEARHGWRAAGQHGQHHPDDSPWLRVGRRDVDLRRLKEVPAAMEDLPPNTIVMTFSLHGDKRYHLPPAVLHNDKSLDNGDGVFRTSPAPKTTVHTIMQRSLRETRMQKGASLAALTSVTRCQSSTHDMQQDLDTVQTRLSRLIAALSEHDTLERSVSSAGLDVSTARGEIERCRRRAADASERLHGRRTVIASRRAALASAEPRRQRYIDLHREMSSEVDGLRSDKTRTLASVCRHRARCTALLDSIFPILPIDPPKLLYTILSAPLPIPQASSETAPPLTMSSSKLPPGVRVDEDSTATALGNVAQVLSHLSTILDKPLLYPVTCAGSRSLVKDYISVIQGGRSFPLYAKGVERYRYEYAVFLLNKDIEALMVESSIKIEDMRHTLPNLKTLLLVLASQVEPAASKQTITNRSFARTAASFRFPASMAMTSGGGE